MLGELCRRDLSIDSVPQLPFTSKPLSVMYGGFAFEIVPRHADYQNERGEVAMESKEPRAGTELEKEEIPMGPEDDGSCCRGRSSSFSSVKHRSMQFAYYGVVPTS